MGRVLLMRDLVSAGLEAKIERPFTVRYVILLVTPYKQSDGLTVWPTEWQPDKQVACYSTEYWRK